MEERTAQLEAVVSKLEAQGKMLRESEQMFRSTFELAAVGMAHVDVDGHVLRANRMFCEIVGYASEELVGEALRSIRLDATDRTQAAVRAAKLDLIEQLD